MPLTGTRRPLGDLQCVVVASTDAAPIRGLAVLCHGYGASADDLVDLADYMVQRQPTLASYRFIFPTAPIDLSPMGMPGGRAWWPLNMAALADAVAAQRFDELHRQEPPGIDASREKLESTIKAACDEVSQNVPLVLGGFSQGAMITMEATLRGNLPPPALLIQWSGCLICKDPWTQALDRLSGTVVLQSHGTADPVLPFDSGRALSDLIDGHTAGGHFESFDGPHTIPATAIDAVADAMAGLAGTAS